MDWFREVEELEKRVNFSRDIMIMDTVQWFTPCGYDAKNTSKLESNLDDLDKEMKSLIDLRSQVQRRVESSDEKQDTTKAEEWLEKAEKLGKKLLLPVDTVVADAFPDPIDAEIETKIVKVGTMEGHEHGLDIGPESAKLFAEEVLKAKTVVWNGPMGVFENPILARGTKAVAQALAEADAITVIGGGDSAAAINQLGFADKVSHISTGGGASLEYLEGKALPGVEAADEK